MTRTDPSFQISAANSSGRSFTALGNETILGAAIAHGVGLPYAVLPQFIASVH